jgi:hypothetical protein
MASISQAHPRKRVVNNAIRVIRTLAKDAAPPSADDDDEPKLTPLSGPGQIRLFSFYCMSPVTYQALLTLKAPSLQAGDHTISITHDIYAPNQAANVTPDDPKKHLQLKSAQEFEVFGLRFSLPPGVIHQTYPPQGHGDHSEVLPHIVFNDAHFPWERDVSIDENVASVPLPRNLTPWLAVLVFTEDELRLTPDELSAIGAGQVLPSTLPPGSTSLIQSTTTLDVNMLLGNVLKLKTGIPGFHCAVSDDDPGDPIDQTQAVNMIFPTGDLFTSLFCSYDGNWERVLPAPNKDTNQVNPDLSRYKYMAHVKQVSQAAMPEGSNTTGSTEDGMGEDEGVYSVIISHRAGPLPGPQRLPETPKPPLPKTGPLVTLPKTAIVHLVSLEGLEEYIDMSASDFKTSRVGLVSLYSWTYTVLPPVGANFLDSMRAIGGQVSKNLTSPLRAPDFILEQLKKSSSSDPIALKISNRLYERALDGASIIRYMPQTGENTIAFCRGALTPNLPVHPLTPFWPIESNFSTNLQIVDKHLGMTDITYSTAWELGRTLAIADMGFTAALNRLRHSVNIYATNKTKEALQGEDSVSKLKSISNLRSGVRLLANLPSQLSDGSRTVDPVRLWTSTATSANIPPTSVRRSPETRDLFTAHIHEAVLNVASAKTDDPKKVLPYNEVNVPKSSDWATVLKWVVDKMYLYNIPAHYLIADPTFLPKESIRFFYIDPNWIDALVDGALSVGNHLETKEDVARQAFKNQLNQYFSHPLDDKKHPYNPQIPVYGFLLRSGVIQAYPNLEVHAPWNPDPNAPWAELSTVPLDPRTQVLRSDLLDKDIMLCLFDRQPGSANFRDIVILQPPHQQRYTVGKNFGAITDKTDPNYGLNELEVEFRKVYTTTIPAQDAYESLATRTWIEGKGEKPATPDPNPLFPNPASIFDFESNVVIAEAFGEATVNILHQDMGTNFTDSVPTSALVGLQLADTLGYLNIKLAEPTSPLPTGMFPRSFPLPDLPKIPAAGNNLAKLVAGTGRSLAALPTTRYTTPRAPVESSAPTPTIRAAPAPHFANTIRATSTVAAVAASGNIPGQFHATAFQLGKAKLSDVDRPIPVYVKDPTANVPLDIIFHFWPIAKQVEGLELNVVNIKIPMGTKNTDLLKSYDTEFGPGSRMLSNLRFNPLLSTVTETNQQTGVKQDYLVVSLVPRSITRLVPLERNPDVSFVLNQATPNGVPGTATCIVKEGYMSIQGGVMHETAVGTNKFSVVKLAVG